MFGPAAAFTKQDTEKGAFSALPPRRAETRHFPSFVLASLLKRLRRTDNTQSSVTDTIRINKFFTQHGICSRREADRLVEAGRVTINAVVAKLGDQVGPRDVIARDGQVIPWGQAPIYIKYHKPVGVTTTSEAHVPRNIVAEISHPERIFPIGRLDKDSSGLILLTNDGDIVNEILRAELGHEREYLVQVDRPFDQFIVGSKRFDPT